MGSPNSSSQLGRTRMLLCNFRARPMAPFVGEISRNSSRKRGRACDEDRRPRWQRRIGRMPASAPDRLCLPACLPAKAPRRSNGLRPRRPPCPARNWLTGQPPDRRRYTPEIGEPSALLLISGREAWPRGVEVDGGRFSGRDGPRTGTGSPGRRCGSPRRLLALAPWPCARIGNLT